MRNDEEVEAWDLDGFGDLASKKGKKRKRKRGRRRNISSGIGGKGLG